ncbi:lysophospholipid acyltransferase family protein [Rhodobacteraceae bacterium KMM 6894]|nr:lysophospholipid acyltransferase family protein [Rhodobacteraceae bacterium KMM 6894]
MTMTWSPGDVPPPVRVTPVGWLRVAVRGALLIAILLVGVTAMALVRLIERPLYGMHRPVTPYITQGVCHAAYVVLGIGFSRVGTPMTAPGAVVSNHVSWLDIFTLNLSKRVYFVSKSEVARWPGIGLLARITGTVFIARDPRQARAQTEVFEDRLLAGHKLLFFPEGTSTDGMRVLPFKTTLFQAFFSPRLHHALQVQPVSLIYTAPVGQDARFYGWWGDMSFGGHLLKTLAVARQGAVQVVYHAPVRVEDFADRKALAAHVEAVVRAGMPEDRRGM